MPSIIRKSRGMIARLWQRDTSLFAPATAPAAVHAAVAHRLGWLDTPVTMRPRLAEIREVLAGARADGLTNMVLLGMGGSSLCADVLRQSVPFAREAANLTMLDSTDERTVLQVANAIDARTTVFLVASKSGSTIEVDALERFFRAWAERGLGGNAGRHFIAVTDPGTPLAAHAAAAGYRHAFINPPDIGGRYSALSLFGLVPAAWLGIDLDAMLTSAADMADRCHETPDRNPGYQLGMFMAEHATAGRDKLTLLPTVPFGMWIEQLVAESTGKDGRGTLPIVDEPAGKVAAYHHDRAFVAMITDRGNHTDAFATELERAGHPVFRIDATSSTLAAEFFRWEFATAVAGHGIGVNPFDEPNVSDAKARTKTMLNHYLAHGAWPERADVTRHGEVERRRIGARADATPGPGYVALLDYLPTDRNRMGMIERTRLRIRRQTNAATTYGVGPRYLHSTGQYHKGGPNSGHFVLMSAADETATEIPGAGYTFSVLKHAQALGDVEALAAAGRDVLHVHLTSASDEPSMLMERVLSE
ncbi:MAG: glucose-6-phosphate isomerase [Acidobacteria bacterium]|nr:MAG: glucose-6-phosphate isomerase [Acidobacteriota bacterium]